jgi:hypothetical protein
MMGQMRIALIMMMVLLWMMTGVVVVVEQEVKMFVDHMVRVRAMENSLAKNLLMKSSKKRMKILIQIDLLKDLHWKHH